MARLVLLWLLCLAALPAGAGQASFAGRAEVQHFIATMAERHGFERAALNRQFAAARPQPRIARMMTGAYVRPPQWCTYRDNFVNPGNISRGVAFWSEHAEELARARERYGIPEEVIVAILGVETRYGRYPMPYRVFDALATLAFDYPRRAEFFRGELEQFLLLMREERRNPLAVKGSFAGALGIPQFMPSSYRKYAVDFDGDGYRDLLGSSADAIGSVAHYLQSYGWIAGEPAIVRAQPRAEAIPAALVSNGLKPERSFADELSGLLEPEAALPLDANVALFELNGENGPEYWLGLNNFYVISRYNRSLYYALAVHQLGEAIRQARLARQF